MPHKPSLPDNVGLPQSVNGWIHDPDSNRNGHVWTGEDVSRSVGVFSHLGDQVRVCVFDDRVDGFANKIEPLRRDIPEETSQAAAVASAVDRAETWMTRHPPDDWNHPDVVEAVFDPPVGFVLDRYYLEAREHIICYRQAGTETDVNLCGRPPKSDASLETRDYLFVEVWRGSGNATVSLAPWLRAHDESKHEVVETPDECGVEVALKLAREWVQKETGERRDSPARGQTDLARWSA